MQAGIRTGCLPKDAIVAHPEIWFATVIRSLSFDFSLTAFSGDAKDALISYLPPMLNQILKNGDPSLIEDAVVTLCEMSPSVDCKLPLVFVP